MSAEMKNSPSEERASIEKENRIDATVFQKKPRAKELRQVLEEVVDLPLRAGAYLLQEPSILRSRAQLACILQGSARSHLIPFISRWKSPKTALKE